MTCELCAYDLDACEAARRAGVARVELCASPYEGGTTPSAGMIRLARRIEGLQLWTMIRPRGGDFLYSAAEIAVMEEEIRMARRCGVDGVVLGVLTADGRVDEALLRRLVETARPLPVAFHRAFDMTRDLPQALETLVRAGCCRVLTSGGCDKAVQGIDTLRQLVAQAAGRIEIMAGSGVGPDNARLLAATGVDALHFSARTMRPGGMEYRNPRISMGGVAGIPEYASVAADETFIRNLIERL